MGAAEAKATPDSKVMPYYVQKFQLDLGQCIHPFEMTFWDIPRYNELIMSLLEAKVDFGHAVNMISVPRTAGHDFFDEEAGVDEENPGDSSINNDEDVQITFILNRTIRIIPTHT